MTGAILRSLTARWVPDVCRLQCDRFVRQAADSLGPDDLVLDAGAGNCRYRDYFKHTRYETADFCQGDKAYGQIDYVGDLSNIAAQDARFDAVVFSQVLEHLSDPAAVLAELHRVLKPGGKLWLSAPLYYEEHEQPYDFYRYTQFGLTHLVTQAGFTIDRMSWMEGYHGTLAHQLAMAVRVLSIKPRDFGPGPAGVATAGVVFLARPVLLVLAALLARADLRHKITDQGHCTNYCVLAKKT